ncbi:hypothetical protein BJ138DRAFT_994081, partial [Hygrophoropsis aurantiaca]
NFSVIAVVLESVAILLGLFRLYYRFSIQRFWWDDAWAALVLFCGIACVACDWEATQGPIGPRVIAYWIYDFSFTGIIWGTRMSILFSIIRLIYPSKLARQIAVCFSTIFLLISGGLIGWKLYQCTSNLSWEKFYTGCPFSSPMAIYQLWDIASDTMLVALPLRMLWNIKMSQKRHREIILSIFSTSILISCISIARAVCRLMHLSNEVYMLGIVEITCCLFVCSLLVVGTYVLRRINKNGDGSDPDSDSSDCPERTSNLYLTTVDLHNISGD